MVPKNTDISKINSAFDDLEQRPVIVEEAENGAVIIKPGNEIERDDAEWLDFSWTDAENEAVDSEGLFLGSGFEDVEYENLGRFVGRPLVIVEYRFHPGDRAGSRFCYIKFITADGEKYQTTTGTKRSFADDLWAFAQRKGFHKILLRDGFAHDDYVAKIPEDDGSITRKTIDIFSIPRTSVR
jgi:hypothetical protein